MPHRRPKRRAARYDDPERFGQILAVIRLTVRREWPAQVAIPLILARARVRPAHAGEERRLKPIEVGPRMAHLVDRPLRLQPKAVDQMRALLAGIPVRAARADVAAHPPESQFAERPRETPRAA